MKTADVWLSRAGTTPEGKLFTEYNVSAYDPEYINPVSGRKGGYSRSRFNISGEEIDVYLALLKAESWAVKTKKYF